MVQSVGWMQRDDRLELTLTPPRVPIIVSVGWFLSSWAALGTGMLVVILVLAQTGILAPWHLQGAAGLSVAGGVFLSGLVVELTDIRRRPFVIRFGARTIECDGVVFGKQAVVCGYRGPGSRMRALERLGAWLGGRWSSAKDLSIIQRLAGIAENVGLDLLMQDLRPVLAGLARGGRGFCRLLAYEIGLTTGTLTIRGPGRVGGFRRHFHGIDEATAARFLELFGRFADCDGSEGSWERPPARSRVPEALHGMTCSMP